MFSPLEIFERDKVWQEHFRLAELKKEHDDPAYLHQDPTCPFCAKEKKDLTSEMIEVDQ